ncbi:hypothetical protein [Ferrimonas balearica]|uniref:hypothetical protein n=1 Tax=Ferrimonas balearica TaxID=44012 RepID=UPI001C56E1A2|nr:hypothetical protein [Ferrimonas balearica]MBW3163213.1 hypothetical protein [Ferrimonas balearica]
MDITQALKTLALDQWYKLLVWLGGLITIGSIFLDVKVLSNAQILPISFGVFLLGLGEWASRRKVPYKRETDHGSKVSGWEFQRFNSVYGNSLSVIGVLFILFGAYKICITGNPL